MSAMAKGPKNGSRKPKVVRTRVSTSSAVAISCSTSWAASWNSAYWSRLSTKPVTSLTTAVCLLAACTRSRTAPTVARRGAGVGDDFDAGDERRRVGEVHAQEAFRVGDRLGQVGDGDRGRVGADDGVRAGGRADAGEGLVLDLDDLGDGFFDEVGVRHGLLDVLGGPEVFLQDCGGAFREEPGGHEFVGFGQEPLVVLLRHFGGHIRERHAGAAERQDLRDPAAHVAGADDGDLAGGVDGGCGCC